MCETGTTRAPSWWLGDSVTWYILGIAPGPPHRSLLGPILACSFVTPHTSASPVWSFSRKLLQVMGSLHLSTAPSPPNPTPCTVFRTSASNRGHKQAVPLHGGPGPKQRPRAVAGGSGPTGESTRLSLSSPGDSTRGGSEPVMHPVCTADSPACGACLLLSGAAQGTLCSVPPAAPLVT